MARIDSLANFLTDVADAIRSKKGTTATIPAQNFDTEINNLGGATTFIKRFTYSSTTVVTCDITAEYTDYANITMDNIVCMPYGIYTTSSGSSDFTWTYNASTGIITLTASNTFFSANIKTKDWKIAIIK